MPDGLTITGARLLGHAADETVNVRVEDGVIVASGSGVEPQATDDVLAARGMLLLPGLVNGHTHAAMTLFRGFGDDLPLHEWLEERIWPAEAKLTADDVYWGTRLACLEMIRSGTTSFADMYWHAGAVARATVDAGLRAIVSAVLLDGGGGAGGRAVAALADDAERSLDQLSGFGTLITPCLGPHAIYTVGPASLSWVAHTSAERDVPVQIHLSETEREVANCVAAHGCRPAELLARVGLLSPRVILAHGCWLDDAELELVAASGATVVTNPVSNMKLAVGRVFPLMAASRAGVALGLGTDGAASNNSLDLLQDAKALALLQKHAARDPAVLPASETLAIATGQRSALLAGGGVEVGARGDLILVDVASVELGVGDLEANLVYAATGHAVNSTIVAGRVLMRDRQVAGAEEVLGEVRARADRLRSL